MITSISDIALYKRCRRQWNYASGRRGNLTTIGMQSQPLELGKLIHLALYDWTVAYYGQPKPLPDGTMPAIYVPLKDPDFYFATHAEARLEEIRQQYYDNAGVPVSDVELMPFFDSIELGIAMCKNYKLRWKRPLDASFVFAAPEQEIIVDIPGTEHYCETCLSRHKADGHVTLYTDDVVSHPYPDCTNCNGTGTAYHKLKAILDGIIEDRRGNHLVLERKTYSSIPDEDSLQNNDQFMGYLWVLFQLQIEKIAGVAYDGLWKRKAPPRGKMLEDLFCRRIVRFTKPELDDWGRQLAAVVNEMANNPIIYPNRRWEGCKDCRFQRLCQSESRGEDIETLKASLYVQRTI